MRTTILFILMLWGSLGFGQGVDSLLIEGLRQKGEEARKEGDYFKALNYFEKSLDAQLQLYGERNAEVANTYIDLCVCNINIGRFNKAKSLCESAQTIFNDINASESKYYADVLAELGGGYHTIGDYQTAIGHYLKSLYLYETNFESFNIDSSYLAYVYYNIGNTYLGLADYENSLLYMYKALAIDKIHGGDEYIADDLDNIAATYELNKEYEKALDYYDQAIALYIKSLGKKHDYTAHAIELKAGCLIKMKKYEEATPLLEEALQISITTLGEIHRDVAGIYSSIGENSFYQKQYDAALRAFKNAEKALGYDEDKSEQQYENISALYDLIDIFKWRATLELVLYKKNSKASYLADAQKSIDKGIYLLDYVRTDFKEQGSKVNLLKKATPVFETAIKIYLELEQSKKEGNYIADVVALMEKGKSILLLESQKKADAEQFAGIPDSLLQKEDNLIADLNYYEEELLDAKSEEDNEVVQNELNSKIFDIKEQYQKLIQQFENNYPEYYRLKHQLDILSLSDIQKNLLAPNETLVEYFVGDSSIYVAIINQDQVQIHTSKRNFPLIEWLQDMRSGILDYHLATSNEQSNTLYQKTLAKYRESAFQLYQKLFQPLEQYNLSNQIIIVPDGILGYLPFDALLTNEIDKKSPLKKYDYLIQKYQMSYIYSATLLAEMRKQAGNSSCQVLAFAPTFEEAIKASSYLARRRDLGALRFNIPESEAVIEEMGGILFKAENANKANFLANASDYCILHLSTHGKANDEVGDASFLAFTEIKDSTDYNDKLFVRELYNLNLNADMVVLSACETGIGELQKGEGIVSLARGFAYAGAKSIITTLWSVDDEETKNIITRFYQNIKTGKNKDAALRQAKLDYLQESSNIKAHPFFWAGYIPLGDMTAIQTKSNWNFWATVIGIISLLAFMFFGR